MGPSRGRQQLRGSIEGRRNVAPELRGGGRQGRQGGGRVARKYRRIDPRIWGDERFRSLETDCKLLALYCLTSPQGNRIGLFRFSLALASEDLETLPETLRERFSNVVSTLKWRFDEDAKVLFLPTWWKYNAPENPNVMVSCLDDLHDVPATPLLAEFCDHILYVPQKCLKH